MARPRSEPSSSDTSEEMTPAMTPTVMPTAATNKSAVVARAAGRRSLCRTPARVVPSPRTENCERRIIAATAAPARPTAGSGKVRAAIHQKTNPVALVNAVAATRLLVVPMVRRNGARRARGEIAAIRPGASRSLMPWPASPGAAGPVASMPRDRHRQAARCARSRESAQPSAFFGGPRPLACEALIGCSRGGSAHAVDERAGTGARSE